MSVNTIHDEESGPTKREQKRQARKQEMLEAAMTIVVREGLEALTIARLAKELNAAVGALYRYFDSKKSLLIALQRQAIDDFGIDLKTDLEAADSFLAAAGRDKSLDPTTALFRVLVAFTAYLNNANRAPTRHYLMGMLMAQPSATLTDEEAMEVEESISPILVQMCALIEDAERVGAFSPGKTMQRTYLSWAAMHGLDYFRRRDRLVDEDTVKFRPLSMAMIRALMIGWGAPDQPLDDAFTLLRFNLRTGVA